MINADIKDLLIQQLNVAEYALTAVAQQQLADYLLLLNKWNQAYNLTSVRDIKEMMPLHILDSLSVADYLKGQRIIDIGTGAGLPGIPLAIVKPEKKFYLLDSNGKKMRFLQQVLQTLRLSNVTLIQERAENYRPSFCFTTIISRAFSQIEDFLEKTQHLSCENGQFLAMKGQYPCAEVAAIKPPFHLAAVHELKIPLLNAQRHLICLSKVSISDA